MQKQNILVIGNGFDLDLELHTKYSDFANSKYWPKTNSYSFSPLAQKLQERKNIEKEWFNIEDLLYEYAHNGGLSEHVAVEQLLGARKEDNDYFNDLSSSLTQFIKEAQNKEPNAYSCAARLLRTVANNDNFTKIYSFNYTDIRKLANRIGIIIRNSLKCVNVHGKADDDSIVLGVSGNSDLMKGYESFKKPNNPHYEGSDLMHSLIDSKEVIVFGHSFGSQDYSYFKDFLSYFSDYNFCTTHKLTVITKNSESAASIKKQIQTQGKITDLTPMLNLGSVNFIKTETIKSTDYDEFLKRVLNMGKAKYHISYI